jgi:UDPglucose--hexose-1-phosphate uridylyltransferase
MSTEVRVDPLTGLKVIIATERAARPGGGFDVRPHPPFDPAGDPFLPGHEDRTPPELHRVPASAGDGWQVRVVGNRYPALAADASDPPAEAEPDLFAAHAATGAHEVIVNAPEPVASLADLRPEALGVVMDAWRDRMRAHEEAACLHLIVNEGHEGGASLPHTHAQLYALDFVPAAIARERERFGAHAVRTMGGNLLGDLVQEEVRRRERLVAVDDEAVLLAPYASRGPYQLMLAPRRPRARFQDDGPLGAGLLADALRRLRAHFGATPALNLWVRTAPRGADHFCWRIDLVPRLAPLAGLELGSGVHLCVVAPEQAAAELREL